MKQFVSRPAAWLAQSVLFGAVALLALPATAADTMANVTASPSVSAPAMAKTANATNATPGATPSAPQARPIVPVANNVVAPASSASSGTLTMLFGLMLVLGLIVCAAWLLKRSGLAPVMQASAAAKVVGAVSVGNRDRVVVVEVADLWIVVGVSPGRVNALATMPKQESVPAGVTPVAKNFSSWMKQTIEKRNAPR